MASSIHQFVSSFSERDAVGKIVLTIQETLQDAGYESGIYAEIIPSALKNKVNNFSCFEKNDKQSIVIYHHTFASDLVNYLKTLENPKFLIYHNITPPEFFQGFDEETAIGCARGIEQLKLLQKMVLGAICFSNYSKNDLIENGFTNVSVIPPVIDFCKSKISITPTITKNSTSLLYVGRIVPHKKVEDILKIFAFYNQCVNGNSKLYLIGAYNISDPYFCWLQKIIEELKLQNVYFLSEISDAKLAFYYANSDVYISMSEHEGFCIPLIESMCYKLPVLAFNATAIPETLNGSGILLKEKNFEEIAELIQIIGENNNLRNRIISEQDEKIRMMDFETTKKIFVNTFEKLVKMVYNGF